jgi:hypothetical protein
LDAPSNTYYNLGYRDAMADFLCMARTTSPLEALKVLAEDLNKSEKIYNRSNPHADFWLNKIKEGSCEENT